MFLPWMIVYVLYVISAIQIQIWPNLSNLHKSILYLIHEISIRDYDFFLQIHSRNTHMNFSTYIHLLLRCRSFDEFSRHPTHNSRVKQMSNARLHAPLAFGCMYAYDGTQRREGGGERCTLPASCGGRETERRQLIDAAARRIATSRYLR